MHVHAVSGEVVDEPVAVASPVQTVPLPTPPLGAPPPCTAIENTVVVVDDVKMLNPVVLTGASVGLYQMRLLPEAVFHNPFQPGTLLEIPTRPLPPFIDTAPVPAAIVVPGLPKRT